MKQITQVTAININADDMKDIRRAFDRMMAETDLQKMAAAMNILSSDSKVVIDPTLLRHEIEECYNEIITSGLGIKDDGTIDINLLEGGSQGWGVLGFMLQLQFNKDKEDWLWWLNLEVSSVYIYPTED